MILSMTGFASAGAEPAGISLAVELRSVNHRYLDVTVRLADELRAFEPRIRERLGEAQRRGKVECRISVARRPGSAGTLAIDALRVRALGAAAAQVVQAIPGTPPLTCADILRWPGVLVEASLSPEALASEVGALLDLAIGELRETRAREGSKLATVLLARCDDIDAVVAQVAPRVPELHAAFVEKLGARLREAGLDPAGERVNQELALFATRIDVAEEVERLSAHVAEFRRVLAQGGSVGKRLDFLAQELHREANTLGSKSLDAELSRVSLELKVAIEQIREQVQNIE